MERTNVEADFSESQSSERLSPSTCGGCTNLSQRKAAILCSACGTRWHSMCAGLKVREAHALSVWHCRDCRSGNITLRASQLSQRSEGSQPTPPSGPSQSLHSKLAELRDSCPVVKRIPKAARASVADSLSSIIDRALLQPSLEVWTKLLSFAFVVLRAPGKATRGTRTSVATAIKKQIADIDTISQCPLPAPERPSKTSREAAEDSVARRIQGKCADGDIKAALRILTSNEGFIQPSAEVRDALLQKHPRRLSTKSSLPRLTHRTPLPSPSPRTKFDRPSEPCHPALLPVWTECGQCISNN